MKVKAFFCGLLLVTFVYAADAKKDEEVAKSGETWTLLFLEQNTGNNFCLSAGLSPFIVPGRGCPNRYDVDEVVKAVQGQFDTMPTWASRLNKVAVEVSRDEIQKVIEATRRAHD